MSDFETKDSGARASYGNGGVRDTQAGKPRFDLLLPLNVPYSAQLLTRWAALMGRGAEKYEDRNWEQFADEEALERAKSSAIRHLMQLVNGERDEDHAAAVLFNVMVYEYVRGVLNGDWPARQAADHTEPEPLWTGTSGSPEPPPHVTVLRVTNRPQTDERLYRRNDGKWQWAVLADYDNPDHLLGNTYGGFVWDPRCTGLDYQLEEVRDDG
jgi:hypothetical protein